MVGKPTAAEQLTEHGHIGGNSLKPLRLVSGKRPLPPHAHHLVNGMDQGALDLSSPLSHGNECGSRTRGRKLETAAISSGECSSRGRENKTSLKTAESPAPSLLVEEHPCMETALPKLLLHCIPKVHSVHVCT